MVSIIDLVSPCSPESVSDGVSPDPNRHLPRALPGHLPAAHVPPDVSASQADHGGHLAGGLDLCYTGRHLGRGHPRPAHWTGGYSRNML